MRKFRTVAKGKLPEIGVPVLIWHIKMRCWVIGSRWPDRYRSKLYHWSYIDVDGFNRLEDYEVNQWRQLPPPPTA